MVSVDPTTLVLVYYAFWFAVLYYAFTTFRQYLRIRKIHSSVGADGGDGEAVTVHGTVSLREAAVPEREPPPEAFDDDRPALLAWRVRRKVRSGGNRGGSRWKTIDGGLAIGEFDIRHDRRRTRVDGDELLEDGDEVSDPFDASNLHFGDPETTVRLGDPNPIQGLLERIGLFGADGLLPDWEVSVSAFGKTFAPDRYEATAIGHGDDVAIRGVLAETDEGLTLRGSGDERPTIVGENLAEARTALRNKTLELVAIAAVAIGALEVVDRLW